MIDCNSNLVNVLFYRAHVLHDHPHLRDRHDRHLRDHHDHHLRGPHHGHHRRDLHHGHHRHAHRHVHRHVHHLSLIHI